MFEQIFTDFVPAVPEMFMALVAMLLLVFGCVRGDSSLRTVAGFSIFAMLAVLVMTLRFHGAPMTGFDGMFAVDTFAVYMKGLCLIGASISVYMAVPYLEREGMGRFEFPVLVMFSVVGMMLMISANNLLMVYLGLELQSLPLYVLAAFHRENVRSSEAGIKYFVLGALSSGVLLYGLSMIYGYSGTLEFSELAASFTAPDVTVPVGLVIGLVFMITGLAFKVSAVPFHMWAPDVYEGAPTPVTAFFAIAPKVAAISLFCSVLVGPFGQLVDEWRQVIVAISIGSMVLGALAGVTQTNIKRLLAYSSIGHMGYALMGLAAASPAGIRGIVIYMTIYMVMSAGAFAVVMCMRRGGGMVEEISDLSGLSRNHPALAMALAILMFSMAGIPPMAGFFGKLFVFQAVIGAQMYGIAVIGVISSVVAAYYYLRVIKIMYFDEPREAFDMPVAISLGGVASGSAVFSLFFVALAAPLIAGAESAAIALMP